MAKLRKMEKSMPKVHLAIAGNLSGRQAEAQGVDTVALCSFFMPKYSMNKELCT